MIIKINCRLTLYCPDEMYKEFLEVDGMNDKKLKKAFADQFKDIIEEHVEGDELKELKITVRIEKGEG